MFDLIKVFVGAIAEWPVSISQIIEINKVRHLYLEPVVSVGDPVDRQTHQFSFFNFIASLMTETSFSENHQQIFVFKPFSHFLDTFATGIPKSVTGSKED